MKPIYRFILHVINNWDNGLNEAYAPAIKQQLFNKFRKQADKKNRNISDDTLNAYIDAFDKLRNSSNLKDKDLFNYSLGQLETIATASPGVELPTEAEITPDVVYNNEDNTIVIYNGSKEELCQRHRSPTLSWCITKTSFPTYRYSKDRNFPAFYLARNTNLDNTNYPLSFVAIQVRDTQENKRYVWTNRENRPNESEPMSFDRLLSEIPWLRDIPNIKSVLKYIPLTPQEVFTQQYRNEPMPYMEWALLLFPDKKSYLVVRKGKKLFNDISNERFVEKYLSKFPDIATYLAKNPEIVSTEELVQSLDKFSPGNQKSILENLRGKVSTDYLSKETFSFDVKKVLTYTNKWDLTTDERIYVTKDKKTIVLLTIGQDLNIALHEEVANYRSVKVNKENANYLLDYDHLDQLPFRTLMQLASTEIISKSKLREIIETAKNNPDSGIIISEINGKQILLDSNSFASYKIENGTVTSIPFNSEEVQQALTDEATNTSFQTRILSYIFNENNLPNTLDKNACLNIINSTQYNSRISNFNSNTAYVVLTAPNATYPIFTLPASTPITGFLLRHTYGRRNEEEYWYIYGRSNSMDGPEYFPPYFEYMRSQNMSYSDADLIAILDYYDYYGRNRKKEFFAANPPLNPNNRYRVVVTTEEGEEKIFLINIANPRDSKVVGKRNNLIRAVITPAAAARLLGNITPAAEPAAEPEAPAAQAGPAPADLGAGERVAAPIRRRGRPPGGGQPRAQRDAAPVVGDFSSITTALGPLDLLDTWNALPAAIRNRFADASITTRVYGDRGAGLRNNILRGRGQVRRMVYNGNNKIYVIQLQNGTHIASMVLQPGNSHYILTPNASTNIGSPSNLLATLQAQNLTESEKGVAINMFLAENPHMLEETKELLRKHLNKNKYETQRS